jgi:hypothetical protein
MLLVRRRSAWIGFLAAVVSLVTALSAGSASAQSQISASVGSSPTGQVMAPGFLGVSIEYSALHLYTGRNPLAVNPALVGLLRGLAPGQSPVLRIGGDSADATWWPTRGTLPPPGARYALTPGWLRTAQALAGATGAHMIMGLNLAGGRPAVAASEARALLQGIGRQYVQAFEIGNEPDLYGIFPWFRDRRGKVFYARSKRYSLNAFTGDYTHFRASLPTLPLAGPAFAQLTWLSGIGRFLSSEPGLQLVTIHRYPLRAGVKQRSSVLYPSIANLLNDRSSSGMAQTLAPYVAMTHARGLPFRLDELNSASNSGQRGLSDTFASALWMLDTLFNLSSVGVDGINVHSLPGAAYELFTFSQSHGTWRAFVHPNYYGMLLFAQAFPPGGQLMPVSAPGGPLKLWATHAPDGRTRVVVINKDTKNGYQVKVQVPGADIVGQASLDWLQAPRVDSTSGVTLGGQSFGDATTTGTLPPPQSQPVLSVAGNYTIDVPPASAAVLTQ